MILKGGYVMTDKEKENIIREKQKNAFYAVNRLCNEEKAQLCMLVCDFCTYYEKSITKSRVNIIYF